MPDVQNPELAAGLKQAKTKPRYYLLVSKGATAVKLIVQKKPIKAAEAQKAKTEAKGTATLEGICLGSGSDLVFEVVGEEPSIKTMSIKELISGETGQTLKPRFQVVKELSAVPESDEDEGGENEDAEKGNDAPPVQPPQSSTPSNQPSNEPSNEPPPAPPPPPPQTTPPTNENDELLKSLVAKMGQLKTQVQEAIQRAPNSRDELLAVVAEFQQKIKGKDAQGARESLLKLGQLIKTALTSAASEGKEEESQENNQADPAAAAFEQRRAALEPKLLEAQKMNREKATALGNVWQYALTQAEGGNYQNANAAFTKLEAAIQDVLKAGHQPVVGEGVVAAGITRLELEKVRIAVSQGMGELEDVLRDMSDQRGWEVANIIRDLSNSLPTELEDALDRLDDAVKSQDATKIAAGKEEVRKTAATWTEFLSTNSDYIAGCENNPWNIPVKIVAPIRDSLAAVMKVAA